MRSALENYFSWLVRRRYRALAVLLAVIAVSAAGASRVTLDFTMEQFFPRWGAERDRYQRYKESFPKEDMQISLFWEDTRPVGVDVYRDLQQAARFFEQVGLEDVRWFGNVELAEVVELDGESGLRLHPLIEDDSLSDGYIRQVLTRHRDGAGYRGYLWNADQAVFAIHGALSREDMEDDARRREIDETLQARLDSLAGEHAQFALSGIPITRSRIPKMLDEDQRRLVTAGIVVFLAVFFLFFRHFGQVLLSLMSIVPAYLATVTIIGLAGKTVTILTGFIPIIILVVGGGDIIHLLSRYRQLHLTETDNGRAIATAFSQLAVPCFYTSLTTAIGFLSLIGTRIGIVIDFGVFTAVAIFLTYGFAMTLLPVLLSFHRRGAFDDRGLQGAWIRRVVELAATVALRPSRRVLLGFSLAAIVGLGLGLSLRVDSFLIDDLKKSAAVRRDLIWIEDHGFGIYQVVLFLRQADERPLHHPDALNWMASVERFVTDEEVVVNAYGLPDLLKPLRRAATDGDDRDATLPATLEEASQLVLLAELRDPGALEDVYRHLDGEAQVIVTVRDAGSRAMLPFLSRLEGFLERNPPPIGTAVSTGTVKLIQNYSAQVLKNFGPSLLIAVVLIFAVMSLMFRSFKQGLIALIPNFFPLLVLLAVMRLAGYSLKPSTILVCSIAFGLAVDSSIHVLGRFRRAVEDGMGLAGALASSVRETGPAILMTATVVTAGFSLLMASRFEVLFLVGMMTAVSAIAAVAADLFVFPAVIAAAWRRGEEPVTAAREVEDTTNEVSEDYPRRELAAADARGGDRGYS